MESVDVHSYMLAMFATLLQTACNLAVWCFDKNGHLYFSTSPHAKELGSFFEIGGCKEYALTEGIHYDKPFLMSDSLGLLWVGEFARINKNLGTVLVLMGPAFVSETSAKTLDEKMREKDISLSMRSIGRKVLLDVPVLTMPAMHQYIKMLHYSATKKNLQIKDIIYQHDSAKASEEALIQPQYEKHFLDYEKSHAREQMIMQCIRDGNFNYTHLVGELGLRTVPDNYGTGDPLREAKNTVMIFTAMCSRAAIEGKLSIKAAKEIEVRYIRRIEKCTTVTQITNIRQAVIAEYVSRVHELAATCGISQSVRDCCDYVKNYFMEPITLTDIAKSVCYSEYYLTRKFQKEMGMSLRDYINRVRLEYAKILLISTEDSIQQISEKVQFGTRNYFTRVFRQQEGCTPSEYRERARVLSQS